MIHGPEGEYIKTSNVREKLLTTGIFLLVAIVLSIVCYRKESKRDEAQNKALQAIGDKSPQPER